MKTPYKSELSTQMKQETSYQDVSADVIQAPTPIATQKDERDVDARMTLPFYKAHEIAHTDESAVPHVTPARVNGAGGHAFRSDPSTTYPGWLLYWFRPPGRRENRLLLLSTYGYPGSPTCPLENPHDKE